MKIKTPERGEIVESVQGKDKGNYYVVCEVRFNCVLVADGIKRKLANPKKKNVKHLRLTPRNIAEEGVTFPWDGAFDNRVAYILKNIAADGEIS